MSYAWKLRHELNNGFCTEVPKSTGFASPSEEVLVGQNEDFLTTDLKEWISPFLNRYSSVSFNKEYGVLFIKVTAVKCCEKGMFESSQERRFNYSNDYASLPNIPEFPEYIDEAQELASFLGIEYRK